MTTASKKLRDSIDDACRRALVAEGRAHWLTTQYETCVARLDEQNKIIQRLIGVVRDLSERATITSDVAEAVTVANESVGHVNSRLDEIEAWMEDESDHTIDLATQLVDLRNDLKDRTEIPVVYRITDGQITAPIALVVKQLMDAQGLHLRHTPEHITLQPKGGPAWSPSPLSATHASQYTVTEVTTEPSKGWFGLGKRNKEG